VAANVKPCSCKAGLEDRIKSLKIECEKFVHERAVLLAKGFGVPAVVLESQLLAGKSVFQAALDIFATKRRDQEIAEREWRREHEARQGVQQ
jgi:hypothetical protein